MKKPHGTKEIQNLYYQEKNSSKKLNAESMTCAERDEKIK